MNWNVKARAGLARTIETGTAVLIGNGVELLDAAAWQLAAVAALGGAVGFVHETAREYRTGLEVPGAGPPAP